MEISTGDQYLELIYGTILGGLKSFRRSEKSLSYVEIFMASFVYHNFIKNMLLGNLSGTNIGIGGTGTSVMLMLTNTTTIHDAGKGTNAGAGSHLDDVQGNEISSSSPTVGYTTGGLAVTGATIAIVDASNTITFTFSPATWSSSTIQARGAVCYFKPTSSSASSACPLIAYLDFGSQVSSNNGDFTVSVTTPLTFSNT